MLKVYANKNNTLFSIGGEMERDFQECSVENLCNYRYITNNEIKLVSIFKKYGANIEYFNVTEGENTTRKAYKKHFKNYNSDVLLIIPVATFTNKEDAEKCKSYLESKSNS